MNDTVVSIGAAVVVGVLSWLIRQLDAQRTKENERRLNDLAIQLTAAIKANLDLSERLRINDIETVKLHGRIALTEASHTGLDKDLDSLRIEIGSLMTITRTVERKVDQLVGSGGRGRYNQGYSPSPSPSESSVPVRTERR
jgi:hypothetical protein